MSTRAISYVQGASNTPLLGTTVGQLLDDAAARWADREALVVRQQNVRWTYKQFAEKVNDLAAGLLALGFEPGDRIGIWSPNCAEWAVTQFATAKAGLILVNVNPSYKLAELEYALRKVECKGLILASSFRSVDYIQMALSLVRHTPPSRSASPVRHLEKLILLGNPVDGMIPFDSVYGLGGAEQKSRLAFLSDQLTFDDPINIQFTSGTTGAPKGATLTHHNIVNNARFAGAAMNLSPADRLCVPVPLYHCFGMVLGNLAAVAHGATMIYPSEAFDPLAVLEAVTAERCTVLHGVPTMFIQELAVPNFWKFNLASLRTGIIAGSPCPSDLLKKLIHQMNLREITIGYGMTETSPLSFQGSPDDSFERRTETVGRVHPHVEAKIVDRSGRTLPVGSPGELLIRGYSVMFGYWGDERKTHETVDAAGWMHTGDIATLDPLGYCNIVGRIKDMVIRGGENIYPREIEDVLYRHPQIEAAQVFGVPDSVYGEEVCAWIRLRADAVVTDAEIREFCRQRISHFKVPKHIRFVSEFPLTVTGKVQKFEMRRLMCLELGVAETGTV